MPEVSKPFLLIAAGRKSTFCNRAHIQKRILLITNCAIDTFSVMYCTSMYVQKTHALHLSMNSPKTLKNEFQVYLGHR